MDKNSQNISEKSEKLKDFLPITIFIILTFLLEAVGVDKSTNLVVSVFISLFIYGVMAAMLREKYGDLDEFKPLQNFIAILSVLFLLIISVAILHWNQILHVNIRWILFFIFMIIYFVFLFRALNMYHAVKSSLLKRKK
jgi:uncharacterized membrane protein YoaK (UPF0700 family)